MRQKNVLHYFQGAVINVSADGIFHLVLLGFCTLSCSISERIEVWKTDLFLPSPRLIGTYLMRQ
jgi:hypothetical protein